MLTGNKREQFDSKLAENYLEIGKVNNIRFFSDSKDGINKIITADYKFIIETIDDSDCNNLYNKYYKNLEMLQSESDVINENSNVKLYITNTKKIYNIYSLADKLDVPFSTVYKCTRKSMNGTIDEIYLTSSSPKENDILEIGQCFYYESPIKENTSSGKEKRGRVGSGHIVIENIINISDLTIEPSISSELSERIPIWKLVSS